MAFTPQFLEDIRDRVPISDFIGRRVKLNKRGREYVGLCPFHNEKTPSFTVSEDKGFFHCFGCGAHGDVIGFAMRIDNLAFPESVERLAALAGLEIPVTTPADRARAERRRSLHEIVEAACAWFEHQLRASAGRSALDYLKSRGLNDESIARFRLGFAPDARNALKKALQGKEFDESGLVEAGLLIRPDDGRESYDRFRRRIIFPIMDRRGQVIAFGGRILGEGTPKYLNSPETPLFQKGRVLYGFSHALPAARTTGEMIVAEGYTDVIALHHAGFQTAVAPLGTALTESQIELLWRVVPEPVLCFDGDDAGRWAAYRAVERVLPILRPGYSLRYALLPKGEDPDSLIKGGGARAITEVLDRARALKDMLWEMETAGRSTSTPERRAKIRQQLLRRVYQIADRTVQQYYRDEIEGRLESVFGRTRSGRARRSRGRGDHASIGLRSDGNVSALSAKVQQAFLAAIINHPELLGELTETLDAHRFELEELDKLRQEIVNISKSGLDTADLNSHLQQSGFSDILDRILDRDIYEAAPFSHPSKPGEEVRREWLDTWARFWRRETEGDLDQDTKALGEDMTPERWAQFVAKRTEMQAADRTTLDHYSEASEQTEVT